MARRRARPVTTEPASPRSRRGLAYVAAALAVATAIGALILRPTGAYSTIEEEARFGSLYDAFIEDMTLESCEGGIEGAFCGTLRLLEGPDEGETIQIDLPADLASPEILPGDEVVVAHYTNPEAVEAGVQYQFVDVERKPVLFWLALIFAAAVVLLGRMRGLAALAGLGASLAILLLFVLPAILDGKPPVAVAVVGASAIAFVALYSAHGFTAKTTVALLGTLSSLALAAGLGNLFNGLAKITGTASEEATLLFFERADIDLAGIVLAGLVIGALGAIDDVTVTQASAVWELRAADARMPRRDLLRAGMRIGRDHVASAVNTLVLAYVGASMTLVLLFVLSGRELAQVANGEIVAVEIVRTLVGSLGLVASVPITTWLAARIATGPETTPSLQ